MTEKQHSLLSPKIINNNNNIKNSNSFNTIKLLINKSISSPTHSLKKQKINSSTSFKQKQKYLNKRSSSLSDSINYNNTIVHWLPSKYNKEINDKLNFGNGLIAFLQKALCTNLNNSQQNNNNNNYKTTILTNRKESPDSGLELEQFNKLNYFGNELIINKNKVKNGSNKYSTTTTKQNNKKQSPSSLSSSSSSNNNNNNNNNSTLESSSSFSFFSNRIFDSFLSTNNSITTMFDFPTMPPHLLDPNGYAQSPVGQLSRSNAVLMKENQQLINKVQDLENSLRDHIAHLNSVYYTLHQRYGFDALQLPEGELVHLSQFKGPEVVLLTFVYNNNNQQKQQKQHRHSLDAQLCISSTPTIDEIQQKTITNNRRNRLLLLQQQIRHKQPPLLSSLSPSTTTSLPIQFTQQYSPPSLSSDSACYSSTSIEQQLVSGPSSTESSSLSAAYSSSSTSSLDPVEMLRQLCIRSSTLNDQQSTEQIKGYVGWLKEQKNEENKEEEEKQRLLEYFRAQQIQAQVQQPLNNNNNNENNKRKFSINTITTASANSEGWRSARSETVPSTSGQSIEEEIYEKAPNSRATWPPRFPLMNKTRKFRSIQLLGNRRSTSNNNNNNNLVSPTCTTSAILSGNHRGNLSLSPRGIGRCSPGNDGKINNNNNQQLLKHIPRRGIGPMATAACRNTLRNGNNGTKRNLL